MTLTRRANAGLAAFCLWSAALFTVPRLAALPAGPTAAVATLLYLATGLFALRQAWRASGAVLPIVTSPWDFLTQAWVFLNGKSTTDDKPKAFGITPGFGAIACYATAGYDFLAISNWQQTVLEPAVPAIALTLPFGLLAQHYHPASWRTFAR